MTVRGNYPNCKKISCSRGNRGSSTLRGEDAVGVATMTLAGVVKVGDAFVSETEPQSLAPHKLHNINAWAGATIGSKTEP